MTTTREAALEACQLCGETPKLHGAQDMGYLVTHQCSFRATDNESGPVIAAWNRRAALSTPAATDRRQTFQNANHETDDVVLCLHCGETLHAPEDDIDWAMTTSHNCEKMRQPAADTRVVVNHKFYGSSRTGCRECGQPKDHPFHTQDAIRALITPAQHDALAAHVAAEVARARAEDADLLYNAWLGLRVLENIAKVKGLSGAADVTTPLLAEIEAAHPEFAPRSALRAQIGAKP